MSKFYSQYGEDAILSRIFPNDHGACVEVGANDGVTFSNSYYFEKLGWRCVLVEPTPSLCSAIRASRSAVLFECAASKENGDAIFHVAEGEGLYSSLEENSTMASVMVSEGVQIKEIQVPTRRLDDILQESGLGAIDFITIDVEGHEISVLHGFSIDRWRPKIMIIEDATDLSETPVSIFMREHGYKRFYRSGGNDWYASSIEVKYRVLVGLLLSRQWRWTGLAKAWLPSWVRGPFTLALRAIRG